MKLTQLIKKEFISLGITEGTRNLPVGESLYKQLESLGFPKSENVNVK